MAEYFVKKPDRPIEKTLSNILLRIVFPLLLLWDAIRYIGSKIGGKFIAQKIWQIAPMERDDAQKNSTHKKHTIHTHDGVHLETIEISAVAQNHFRDKDRQFIIYFPDFNQTYQSMMSEMQEDVSVLQHNAVGFNYRYIGINNEELSSICADGIVTDGIAQVQRLLDLGVKPGNITLKGRGFGAAIATLVTEHFCSHKIYLYLFCDRSFSSLAQLFTSRIYPSSVDRAETVMDKIIYWSIFAMIKATLSATKWDIDIVNAYKSISDNHKEYIVVRTRRAIRTNITIDDQTIPHHSSLHMALKPERIQNTNTSQSVMTKLSDKRARQMLDTIIASKKTAQTSRKMEVTHEKVEVTDGHNVPLNHLKNRYEKSASAFFSDFVRHHALDKPSNLMHHQIR